MMYCRPRAICNSFTLIILFQHEFGDEEVSNWSTEDKEWKVTRGTYVVRVGPSAGSLPLKAEMVV